MAGGEHRTPVCLTVSQSPEEQASAGRARSLPLVLPYGRVDRGVIIFSEFVDQIVVVDPRTLRIVAIIDV